MTKVQHILAWAVVVVGVSAAVVVVVPGKSGRRSSGNIMRMIRGLQVQLSLDIRLVGRISRGGSRKSFDQTERNLGRSRPAEGFVLCVVWVVSCAS